MLCALVLAIPAPHGAAIAQTDGRRTPASREDGGRLFDATDAVLASVLAGSLLLIPALEGLDEGVIRRIAPDASERDGVARVGGRTLGSLPGALALTGGTYALGRLGGNRKLQSAGLHSLEALLLAEVATRAVKITVGRLRPTISDSSDDFDPPSVDPDKNSFPSGHTSHAFAVAAAFSAEYGGQAPWVPFIAYPLATWVATTRVLDRKHWVTDVVAGAALGVLSARLVERWNDRRGQSRRALRWSVAPTPDGGIALAAMLQRR